VPDDVKTPAPGNPARRRYRSAVRSEQAAATRAAVLRAALELFTERGYAGTPVSAIAGRAGVAVDTVYAAAGRKPDLMRELVETAISGEGAAVPALQRDYVRRVRDAATAREKVALYAAAVAQIAERMLPVQRALAEAAVGDPACAALRDEISARRAANMRLFAGDLRATGELRTDLDDDAVADVVWSMNAPEYQALLLGERGWSAARYGDWLADAWARLLLAP
jgi:AcrR family transcriptional regulator